MWQHLWWLVTLSCWICLNLYHYHWEPIHVVLNCLFPFFFAIITQRATQQRIGTKTFIWICSTYVMIWHYFDIYCVTRYTSRMLHITVLLIICKLNKTMFCLIMKYLETFCSIISLLWFFPFFCKVASMN